MLKNNLFQKLEPAEKAKIAQVIEQKRCTRNKTMYLCSYLQHFRFFEYNSALRKRK